MSIQASSTAQFPAATSLRRLLVVWQNPLSRRFVRVGQLDQLTGGRFAFRYTNEAKADAEFFPLDEYPDLDAPYVSDSLPVFFTNRIMSSERPSYPQYLGWLGLVNDSIVDVPIEVLVRTGASRATDTFHIVEHPLDLGDFTSRFFVSGIRHYQGATDRVKRLEVGARLELRSEPSNKVNPAALLIDVEEGDAIGWVPDWLCGELNELIEQGYQLRAFAEKINLDAPAHVQVLCRVEATQA